jgi:lysosomal acid lipase/cholesteryl ester hydrolase
MLFHGFLDSGDSYCMNGREKSPAFILADAGYDVWIVNSRGNKHSRGHTNLNHKTDVEYWRNAMGHHIRQYDIPSFIETIKNISKVENMTVVAHSQANNLLFKNMAQNQSYYQESINLMISLGPFGKLTTTSGLNTFFIYLFTDYLDFWLSIGYFHAFEPSDPHSQLMRFGCLYLEIPC